MDVSTNLGYHRSTIYQAINYIKRIKWQPEKPFKLVKFRTRQHKRFKKFTLKIEAYQGKHYKYGNINRCLIKDRVDISNRPSIVEAKKRIGDIEEDTIVVIKGGAENCLLTLVDRVTQMQN